MALKKIILKAFLPSCYKPNNQSSLEPKLCPVSRNTSYRRLFLSDISDSSASTISDLSTSLVGSNLHIFTHKELKKITQNFCKSNFLGGGGFGQVYKGFIDEKLRSDLEAQPVAVKILDLDGSQGHREWLAEVIFLGQLKHPHLVNLVGYCCEDEHRLLVYEYMARGDLDNQIFKSYTATLPWLTRLKIAIQAAKGLAFLHEEEKQVIYRDFKASNILLDHDFTAKLSDFGLAIDGPEDNQTYITTSVMGTVGYAAPEYILTGHLTTMSDVYSFGVVLLEILTGKRCIDKSRSHREKNLVDWAKPIMKDPRKLERLMDPKLEGQYSTEGARKAASLAYKCLSPNPKSRPTMRNVVKILEPLMELNDIPCGPFVYIVPTEERYETELEKNREDGNKRENKVVKKLKQEENMVEIEAKRRQKSSKGLLRKVKSLRSSAVYCDTVL